MIKIFTGEDRVRAGQAIKNFLGENYEVIDAQDLGPNDLPQIFQGMTLFDSERKIMIRDFLANKAIEPEIVKYLNTPHKVALFELKLDKRTAAYREIKDKVEILEFNDSAGVRAKVNRKFEVYRAAKTDGKRAVEMLRTIKEDPAEDPVAFVGLMASQVMKEFAANPNGVRERRNLKALARMDLEMKATSLDSWLLIEAFLMRLA